MKKLFTFLHCSIKLKLNLSILTTLILLGNISQAQLGVYSFTGVGACPNQNPAINTQPSNATFTNFTSVGMSCYGVTNVNANFFNLNTTNTVNLAQYNSFTLSGSNGYGLSLDSLSFNTYVGINNANCKWILRSSLDNYSTDIASDSNTVNTYNAKVYLASASFKNITSITFRFYVINMALLSSWGIDEVKTFGITIPPPSIPTIPISNSPQCASSGGVTLNFSATPPTDVTWYWQSISTGTSLVNSTSNYNVTTSGTYYLRAYNSTTQLWSVGSSSIAVIVNANVLAPIFTLGTTSTRCQSASSTNYIATSTNATSIAYSLDGASIIGGNTINVTNGVVNYSSTWLGESIITATANGCNGPVMSTHTVSTVNVGTPVFAMGNSSIRCQGSTLQSYVATATNATSIIYSLDALSITGNNTINSITGTVSYHPSWSGTTIITARANGCNGPTYATHTVTVTPTVGTPSFVVGSSSSRCQGGASILYSATASNSTAIVYTIDAASITGGNSIVANSGLVTFVPNWNGTTIITASANGCNGPIIATHTVTVTPTVGSPIFSNGIQSLRNQGAGSVTYTATATNNTGIIYSLDAASIAGGNTINGTNGMVTWTANWYGTSYITASATGCNGPINTIHIVNINPIVIQTPLYLSIPGEALDRIDPVATNIIPTTISAPLNASTTVVTLDATSTAIANTSNISTTVSHITGTKSNRLMLVGISHKNRVVTSVTYGGVPLTLVGENNSNSNARIAIYKLINPNSGNANVIVTFNSNPDRGAIISVNTFSGVDQTNALGTFYSTQTKSSNPSLNLNSATNELIFDVLSIRSVSATVGAGQTQKWNINTNVEMYGAGSTKTGIANTNMNWTSANADWALGAVSIKPAVSLTSIEFTQTPVLCNNLTIKAQTIQVLLYLNVTNGVMPINPAINASLKYGSTNIITLSNPVYNNATKIISWTGLLGADVNVPDGQSIKLEIATTQPNVEFQIEYHSTSKPSRISLLPVSTFIDFVSFDIYNAPYPNGSKRVSGSPNTTYYARAKVTTPFGYKDLTGLELNFTPPNSTVSVVCVDSTSCTRTYEYPWTTGSSLGSYYLFATAKEGFENTIKNSELITFDVCSMCPPVALNDTASGPSGNPIIVDVLLNDYDPNNNLNLSTLSILQQPNNGTGYVSNNKIVYLPNGSFFGKDTLRYQICDATGLCTNAFLYVNVSLLMIDPCAQSTKSHTYFLPYPEEDSYDALSASSSVAMPSNNIRTVISLTIPYSGMYIVWDHWEDGYEINFLNPLQSTTKVWGDGNPYNGIAPGYSNDIIPPGGSIILDNTMAANPRVQSNFYFDGKDKIVSTGQIAVTQVSGEPTFMPVQAIKTNVTSTNDFGQSFTVPLGENFNSRDFRYTALFIRAELDNTTIEVDKDNNGIFETSVNLNQGGTYFINGGVKYGATIASTKPVGVELNAGGVDNYSIRNASIYPATWYSNTYYTPVPTSDNSGDNPKDTSAVMFYNSLNRPITINWTSGAPASGTIALPAKTCVRFPLAFSNTATYKFHNPTGESFTAIEIVDSYIPGSTNTEGITYDWSFNLIAESRLTDFATTAWAPGGLDMDGTPGPDVNGNPIWVTPNINTTIYVKWDGNISGTTGLVSPCGLRYDVAYPLNALNYMKLKDPTDNDQSGLAVYTCNNAKIAAVYGEDPQGSGTGVNVAYWDVGTTVLPFCKQKLIFANDDYARTMVSQPVTISVLLNDAGFLAVIDPTTVSTIGLLQPKNGTTFVNANGTIIYTPNPGFVGKDTFDYRVCSTPAIVCDDAKVYVTINSCPAPPYQNLISGQVFLDKNDDGIKNDGGAGIAGPKVYLYVDGNCNAAIDANELKDSVTVDISGSYQFTNFPEKIVSDNFDGLAGARTCGDGTDGTASWLTDWADAGDPSTGFCNTTQSLSNTDCEIVKNATGTNVLRLKDNNVSATRTINLTGANYAFLSFSYKRVSASLSIDENILVQVSNNGTTFNTIFTIFGNGTTDANFVDVYNQDILAYASGNTSIRFLTNNDVDDADSIYIDNIKIQYIKYPQCYIVKLNPSTVPANYHTTTVLQYAITVLNPSECLGPYDFGVSKNKITVSGTVYRDANGLKDNLVNGPTLGTFLSNTLYAYLKDSTGKVVNRATVNSTNGNYTFTGVDVLANYNVSLSTISVNVGDVAPSFSNFAISDTNWVATGEAYGVNNLAGIGNRIGSPSINVEVKTSTLNITGVNFGLEELPESYDRSVSYQINIPNVQYKVACGLGGIDAEDGILELGKTYKITSLPLAAILYYDGTAVTLNQVITNFDSTKLVIDPDDEIFITRFTYASQDAAGMFDPIPNTIEIVWISILPVTVLNFDGYLNGDQVNLKWSTTSEINNNYFNIEKSLDGFNFTKIDRVDAKIGNGIVSYDAIDLQPTIGTNYYRLKIVDKQGNFFYSSIINIDYNKFGLSYKAYPNPFVKSFELYINLKAASKVYVSLIDINGKEVYHNVENGVKGKNLFKITNLDKLTSAHYALKIVVDDKVYINKIVKK